MKNKSSDSPLRALYGAYRTEIEKELSRFGRGKAPATVYEPIHYVLSGGGKRIRAILTLLSSEAVGGKREAALHPALAIEILHNFTLVHDDIMDHAPLRRGRLTVHKKWDENTAILSGDEMIAQAYKEILKTDSPNLKPILGVYTNALVEVCEGQGLDKEFETRRKVTMADYIGMISKKTGRVISAAAEMGALAGNGTMVQVKRLRKYGEYLGLAFQIMDDLLDITGSREEFGKKIGGDIQEGKKTFLLLKSLERCDGKERKILSEIGPGCLKSDAALRRIKNIYLKTGTIDAARAAVRSYTLRADRMLEAIPDSQAKSMLRWLSSQLLGRTS